MTDPLDPSPSETALPPAWLIVLAGFAVALALCWPQIARTWATGDFLDTDDAMRMVQVRDWIAGQGWFDLTAHRLDPPAGSPMHWSRIVDMPIALLLKLASLVLPVEEAERATRIAYPLLLQLALLASLAWVGRLLAGPRGGICAVVLGVLSGFMFGQFMPGRVDHHSMQIVLLLIMTGGLLAALDEQRPKMAVLGAAALALSLSISLENLPMIAAAAAVLPLAWLLRGPSAAPALRWFGLGLAMGLPACFALFHADEGRWQAACDAYSIVHLGPGLAGALACLALSWIPGTDWRHRTGGVLLAAMAVLLCASPYRACLADPFDGLDPLVRDLWLGNTTEVRSLRQVLALHPSSWPMVILPDLLGPAGLIAGAAFARGLRRARWLSLLPIAGAAALTATIIIRAETSLSPLAALGGVFVCCWLWHRSHVALALLAALPFSTIGWALVTPPSENVVEAERLEKAALCREAKNYPALAALPPGLAFAPMDAGAHLLAQTSHSVLAAPYHRNNRGNRLVIDALLAPPEAAEALVRGSGARWLMICPGEVQLAVTAAQAPAGLSARLLAGDVPGWLIPVEVQGSGFKVFRLR